MVFNSIGFFVFFAIVLGLHNLPLPWRVKKLNLVIASSLFYAAWNPFFLALLWLSIIVDWQIATRMTRFRPEVRKRLLFVSLIVNLGALSLFKYADFITQNVAWLMSQVGLSYQPSPLGILLPVGISFYTFETLSYTIDVYRGEEKPWKSFLDFTVFLTFFPHLVAGPIVRPSDFLPQCDEPRRATRQQLGWGLSLLVFGLFEKTVIADGTLAPIVDRVFHASAEAGIADAWCGALAFAGQIFCDFAGYSLCAVGVALCFGFLLPDNFNAPYAAVGFSDFWQRWHISLSSWLRDYLYVSLGGNRSGRGRTFVNLALTMLLGGLWHGASWTFVIWGGLHGTYLIGERVLRAQARRAEPADGGTGALVGVAITFLLTTIAWVFFRSTTFQQASSLLLAMSGLRGTTLLQLVGKRELLQVLVITGLMLALQWRLRATSLSQAVARVPWPARAVALGAMTLLILTDEAPDRAFIYFQF